MTIIIFGERGPENRTSFRVIRTIQELVHGDGLNWSTRQNPLNAYGAGFGCQQYFFRRAWRLISRVNRAVRIRDIQVECHLHNPEQLCNLFFIRLFDELSETCAAVI